MATIEAPTLSEIREARVKLDPFILETPMWQWQGQTAEKFFGEGTQVFLKLEILQYTGTFKLRGALMVMLGLSKEALKYGVTAMSAGNHAVAVAYAARVLGTSAKVTMPKTANPARIQLCKEYGGEVVLTEDIHAAYEKADEIKVQENRSFIHPFEGPLTALGTATLGMEICQQTPNLDAVIVPIGGGGLCAGVASAVKQLQPLCKIYGVEPEGADTMHRSFASGKPESIDQIRTIADSLGAGYAAPYSFALCQRYVDELVKMKDQAMCQAMALLFREMKLAVEPAGAISTAALCGPLREKLKGKRICLILCGTNIDLDTFYRHTRSCE